MKNWYNNLSNQWKATLRSSFQAAVGSVLAGVLLFLVSVQNAVNGEVVDLVDAISVLGKTVVTAAITFCSGLVTYLMNRNEKGARY